MQEHEVEYVDVSNIEKNPKLFLKIFKAYKANKLNTDGFATPQDLADEVLEDCKKGLNYAQFLIVPENPILKVCRIEGISRRQLAELINMRVTRLENCLSRKKVSKSVLAALKERFNYI